MRADTEIRPPMEIVLDREGAEILCERLLAADGPVSVDTEWYNHDKDRTPVHNGLAFCATFAHYEGSELKLTYLHNYGESDGNIYALKPFWDSDKPKILHNAPSDWHILGNHGILMKGPFWDTMVMDHLIDENREDMHGLKECAQDFLHVDRTDFNHTFGDPKLRQDGQPYASGQLIVPTLPEYVEGCEFTTDWGYICEQAQLEHSERMRILSQEKRDIGKGPNFRLWKLIRYATNDPWDAMLLYELYAFTLSEVEWVHGKTMLEYFNEVDVRITEIICKMERKGMHLDLAFMAEMAERCLQDLEEMNAKALEWAGCPMNIGSGPQLVKLLYGKGPQVVNDSGNKKKGRKRSTFTIMGRGWPVLRTTEADGPSTKAEHLLELRRHLEKMKVPGEELAGFDWILEYKKYEKQRNTYLVGLAERAINSRVHGRINQIGTTSSRFSSSDPNLQNQPTGEKDVYNIRDCFTAPPGHLLLVADWKNLEYRLLAHYSQDPKLLRVFGEGLDMHSFTGYNIFPHIKHEVDERFGGPTKEALDWVAQDSSTKDERKKAKTLNFEIIYGVGHKKLADQLRISFDAAKGMIDGWFRSYPYVKAWMTRLLHHYREHGWARMIDGRMRHADMVRLNHKDYGPRGEEERSLINAVIQGSASAMAKRSMIRIDECKPLRELGYEMIMQVHDEIIGECPIQNCKAASDLIRPIMEQPFTRPLRLEMPVSIDWAPTWASAK